MPDRGLPHQTTDEPVSTRVVWEILGLVYNPGLRLVQQGVQTVCAATVYASRDTSNVSASYAAPEIGFANKSVQHSLEAAHLFQHLQEDGSQMKSIAECVTAMSHMLNRLYTLFEAIASLRARFHHALHINISPEDSQDQLVSDIEELTDSLGTGSIPLELIGPLVTFLVGGVKGLMVYPTDKGRYRIVKLTHFMVLIDEIHGERKIEEPIWKYTQKYILDTIEDIFFP
ncbi:uncharacterized protein MELLADRAFT_67489 [Melampsora larici-populina 98AG31]|uniref:Uncharacterized protein n=1 Tax=Melampsora larici-populina (strain 98AG31 / pathotype 3-4-7) TaxID=747676 RepID=F4S3B4_MELLP|nr:uncharacterized protein MELLADRAFT_67489 [Melampsora larici-populina 98AG31]EGG00787.1 hypothetical protein MELLADRAFT_67489 [Melampsora larici-populina 98AG31]